MPIPKNHLLLNERPLLCQTLALYGLRLSTEQSKMPHPTAKREISPEAAAKTFVTVYCKHSDGTYTVKSEIREAFTKYFSLYSSKSEHCSLVVCNYLNELGYDDTHKKRVRKGGNPVAVILNLDFDKEKFYNDFKTITEINTVTQETQKETFDLQTELSKAVINISFDI